MDIEYIKENYRFETLTEEHDLSNFKCASDDLNDFLKSDALTQQKSKLNLTKLSQTKFLTIVVLMFESSKVFKKPQD